jgi:hypothetical protein
MEDNAMTINLEDIYDQYREADFNDRLNIYLQYPELRDDFCTIEEQEEQTMSFGTDKSQAKPIIE